MGKINVEGMSALETVRKERKAALDALTSTPFDVTNNEQQTALLQYMDNFEFSLNQRYLFQGMAEGLKVWGGPWLLGFVMPMPDFVKYFFSTFLYVGASGYILEHFSINDFYDQLDEMKTIYNWCLKNKEPAYDGTTDNTAVLSNSNIQRMIRLIAPLCDTEFLLAWKKVTEPVEPKNPVVNAFSVAYSFFAPSKPSVDLTRLQDLKASVEKRELDVGVFKGCELAVRFFSGTNHFKDLMMTMVKPPVESIRGMLPSVMSMSMSPSKND